MTINIFDNIFCKNKKVNYTYALGKGAILTILKNQIL
jgi:hypothetical protein